MPSHSQKVKHSGRFCIRSNAFCYEPDFVRQHNKRLIGGKEEQGVQEECIDEAALLEELANVPWTRVQYKKFGTIRKTPRYTWCYGSPAVGQTPAVKWKGIHNQTEPIPKWALPLKRAIEKRTDIKYNVMLLNKYSDGQDNIGWHRDDEQFLADTTVASVSLGAVRDFCVREDESQQHQVPLQNGSLTLLYGSEHSLPRRSKQAGTRYNITFRAVRTEGGVDSHGGFGNYYRYSRGE